MPAALKGRIAFYLDGHAETGDGIVWVDLSKSPSGTYVLLWRDAADDGSAVGDRTAGPGRYRLIEQGGDLRCDGRLERPNDGKVADNGTFALADWQFGDGLHCRFLVMTADGQPVIDEAFGANAHRVAISDDGRFAAIHLASNPDAPEYDELFALYDVTRGRKLWSKPLECGRAEGVAFDPGRAIVHVTTKTFGSFGYGLLDGSTDESAIREAILARGTGFEILTLVTDEVGSGQLAPERGRRLVADCERASAMLGEYPGHAARALRLAGEILHAQGDLDGALALWDRALATDSKVGVRRRAAALRAEISQGKDAPSPLNARPSVPPAEPAPVRRN